MDTARSRLIIKCCLGIIPQGGHRRARETRRVARIEIRSCERTEEPCVSGSEDSHGRPRGQEIQRKRNVVVDVNRGAITTAVATTTRTKRATADDRRVRGEEGSAYYYCCCFCYYNTTKTVFYIHAVRRDHVGTGWEACARLTIIARYRLNVCKTKRKTKGRRNTRVRFV